MSCGLCNTFFFFFLNACSEKEGLHLSIWLVSVHAGKKVLDWEYISRCQ